MSETAPPGNELPRQPGERREPRFDPSGELATIYRERAQKSDTDLATERSAREALEKRVTEMEAATSQRMKDAERAADERVMRAELRHIGASLGLVDADVLKLVDLKAAGLKLDDKGDVVGAKEAIEALKASKPWAFKQTAADKGSSSSNAPSPGAPSAEPKDARTMTDAEYAALRASVTRRR